MSKTTKRQIESELRIHDSWIKASVNAAGPVIETTTARRTPKAHYLPDPVIARNPCSDFVSTGDLLDALGLKDEELKEERAWISEELLQDPAGSLRQLRLGRGLSQAALASLLDSQQSYVSRLESGSQDVTRLTMRKLRDALGVDMNAIDIALQIAEDRFKAREQG